MKSTLVIAAQKKEEEQVTAFIRNHLPAVTVAGAFDTFSETRQFLQHSDHVDLLICDVTLKDGNSSSLIHHIGINVPVIFLADDNTHALEAFRFHALGYVMKPIQKDEFNTAIQKFLAIQNKNGNLPHSSGYRQRFVIKSGNKLLIKHIDEAAYFLADGKVVYMVTTNGKRKFIVDYTLEEVERSIDPTNFFRISRKHLVCINCIEEVRGLMSGKLQIKLHVPSDDELIVSRERVQAFKRWLEM